MPASKRMATIQVQLDPQVLDLLRQEGRERMLPVSELARVAIGKWLVNQRRLRAEQLNAEGRLIPEGLQRKAKRRPTRSEPVAGNGAALHGEAADATE